MPVQWGLGQGNNALANFGYGLELGQNFQDRRDQREQANALLDLRKQQEERLRAEAERTQAKQQQEQRRADLPMLGRLLEYAQDEGTYQRARQVAEQYGVDTSSLPPAFDPAWRDQQLSIVKLMQTPRGQEVLSNAGKQAVDAGFQPGTPEFSQTVQRIITADLVEPYTGSQGETRLHQPDVFGGGQQQPSAVPFDPNEWEVVDEGGGVGNGTGGF